MLQEGWWSSCSCSGQFSSASCMPLKYPGRWCSRRGDTSVPQRPSCSLLLRYGWCASQVAGQKPDAPCSAITHIAWYRWFNPLNFFVFLFLTWNLYPYRFFYFIVPMPYAHHVICLLSKIKICKILYRFCKISARQGTLKKFMNISGYSWIFVLK